MQTKNGSDAFVTPTPERASSSPSSSSPMSTTTSKNNFISHIGLLFNKASIWMGFRVSGKSFSIVPLMEDHHTEGVRFQKMDISSPSSRFLLIDDISSYGVENTEEQRSILFLKLNSFMLSNEQEIRQKLIKFWDENVSSPSRLFSFDELVACLNLEHENICSEIGRIILEFATFYILTDMPHFEKSKHELTFKSISREKIRESTLRLKFTHQLDNITKGDVNIILDNEELVILKCRILECLMIQSESKYWQEFCKYMVPKHKKNLEGKVKFWLHHLGTDISLPEALILKSNVFPPELNELVIKCILKLSDPVDLHHKMKDIVHYTGYKEKIPDFTKDWKYYDNVITIDSEGTMDIDDAISILECNTEGLKVAIHITNVGHFLYEYVAESDVNKLLHHHLFKEASRKVTSHYICLPKGSPLFRTSDDNERPLTVFPMLPPSLSEDLLSLKEGLKVAMTYVFDMKFGQPPSLINIHPSRVSIVENTTYEKVEELFDTDERWEKLYQYCIQIQSNREKQTGQHDLPYIVPHPSSNTTSDLIISSRRTLKGSVVIGECAFLVGSLVGEYFSKNNIPGIARVFDDGISRIKISNEFITSPYIQQTSPVRRFIDTLNQIQLYLYLTRQAMLSEEQLELFKEKIDSESHKSQDVEDNTIMYWVLCNLWQNYRYDENQETQPKHLKGTVGKQDEGCVKIKLERDKFCSFKILCSNLDPNLRDTTIHFLISSIDWEELTVTIKQFDL